MAPNVPSPRRNATLRRNPVPCVAKTIPATTCFVGAITLPSVPSALPLSFVSPPSYPPYLLTLTPTRVLQPTEHCWSLNHSLNHTWFGLVPSQRSISTSWSRTLLPFWASYTPPIRHTLPSANSAVWYYEEPWIFSQHVTLLSLARLSTVGDCIITRTSPLFIGGTHIIPRPEIRDPPPHR